MFPKVNPSTTKSWSKLVELSNSFDGDIRKLLSEEPDRLDQFTFKFRASYFDFSKSKVTSTQLSTLLELAEECRLKEGIEAQFTGERINETENRAVLHTALRDLTSENPHLDLVRTELDKIRDFSTKLINGSWLGHTGEKITDIVNIGIGGSDLGPKMVTYALKSYWKGITPHFVSNVDASQLIEELEGLNPETTLFIIASKTFTTQETMTNAISARDWFLENGGSESAIAKHFVAVSTNKQEVVKFGIDEANMFVFWEWVGGRYSLWSSIGLSIACTTGYEHFESLLGGAHEMDLHFSNASFSDNIPVISALIGIWYNNFLGYDSQAILPYDHLLRYLPSYLQQADMESNGKYVARDGEKVSYQTGPIIWGEPGTNGQHAFYQLIHQGTKTIPCEFIAFAKAQHDKQDHHDKLLANFFAQSEALLMGKDEAMVLSELNEDNKHLSPFKVFEGNKPSTSILLDELTPFNLGALIAYYEHKIFVQGFIWNIFSYDQWGVELGKQLAKPILKEVKEKASGTHDSSTNFLLEKYHELRR